MPARDHRQLGVKLGRCVVCDRHVWSRQASRVVQAEPVKLEHVRCPRAQVLYTGSRV